MKDYKLLLAGLILLLLVIFIAIFTWLWSSNRKNIDPLPIMANANEPSATTQDEVNTLTDSTLYIKAEENLQAPLDDIIVSFESRYPHVQVLASYVPANDLLTLSDNNSSHNKRTELVTNVDMIIANDSLSADRLTPLQTELKSAQDKINQDKANIRNTDAVETDNAEARTLNSFSYALRDKQTLEGVILTENTAAINFRNFLLSSTGQDILEKYDYYNIEGYKNSVDDLFNPTSRAQKTLNTNTVNVADALSNGE
jgi:ABC-type molybdate transport system substrate-binding protein